MLGCTIGGRKRIRPTLRIKGRRKIEQHYFENFLEISVFTTLVVHIQRKKVYSFTQITVCACVSVCLCGGLMPWHCRQRTWNLLQSYLIFSAKLLPWTERLQHQLFLQHAGKNKYWESGYHKTLCVSRKVITLLLFRGTVSWEILLNFLVLKKNLFFLKGAIA
jgi:hypothetical protein